MRFTRATLSTLLATSLLFSACVSDDPKDDQAQANNMEETKTFEVVQDLEVYEGEIDYEDVDFIKDANDVFAFQMYVKLRGEENKNLFFSPFSISRAFSNYYSPGQGEHEAFEAVFGFSEETTEERWKMISHLATDRSQFDDVEADKRSLFASEDVYWIDDMIDATGNFDRIHRLDLDGEPEKSRGIINAWIAKRSGGLLTEFLDPGLIDPFTEAVTTNVVFFLGAWAQPLEQKDPLAFMAASGEQERAAFGGTLESLAVVGEDVTVATIPYAHRYDLVVLMPHDDFDGFASQLTYETYAEHVNSQQPYEITFTLPEFEADSAPDIVKALDARREETGTTGGTLTGAFMETYVHKAKIKVDKEGTRAAAATAIIEYGNNGEPDPLQPLTVAFDRPFFYAITDANSGSILFMGEYTGE